VHAKWRQAVAAARRFDDEHVAGMHYGLGAAGEFLHGALGALHPVAADCPWRAAPKATPVNRIVGDGQLVDERHVTFSHSKPMNWFLPNVPPTNKKVYIDIVVIVQFRGDKLACERIYWDHATVLRHVGLLQEKALAESIICHRLCSNWRYRKKSRQRQNTGMHYDEMAKLPVECSGSLRPS